MVGPTLGANLLGVNLQPEYAQAIKTQLNLDRCLGLPKFCVIVSVVLDRSGTMEDRLEFCL